MRVARDIDYYGKFKHYFRFLQILLPFLQEKFDSKIKMHDQSIINDNHVIYISTGYMTVIWEKAFSQPALFNYPFKLKPPLSMARLAFQLSE